MKHSFRRLVIAALLGSSAPLAAQNIVQNGSFEDGPVIPNPPGFVPLNPGSTAIPHWIVVDDQVDYVSSAIHVIADGERAIDLNGSPGAGAVIQPIFTTPGQDYVLSFAMAGDATGPPAIKTMWVNVEGFGGSLAQQFFQVDNTGQTQAEWTRYHLLFTADDVAAVIRFASTMPVGHHGPLVDDVRVEPQIGLTYCINPPNSTGAETQLAVIGSLFVADNDVQLVAWDLPPGEFGLFLVSRTQGSYVPANTIGTLCLGGDIGRFVQPGQVGVGPWTSITLDLNDLPLNTPGSQQVQPGDCVNFQYWTRDGSSEHISFAKEVQFQ